MARPEVSVVMPFAGDAASAREAVRKLRELALAEGDELIIADNSGTVPPSDGVRVIRAAGEASPAHARNVGAASAHGEWILFLDSDCHAPADLLDAYFAAPVEPEVGALAGEVVPASGALTLAERYGAARGFLGQAAHLAHPYLPRAVAANLVVRRSAFERVGGFYEGVRAAEDTDFSWRLQQAGWRLELRPEARVEHSYRTSLRELRRQWRGYAAGRAWLGRRYGGFRPEPAVQRATRRLWRRLRPRRGALPEPGSGSAARREGARFLALDALLAAEELRGLVLSNRPRGELAGSNPARVVFVADRFPSPDDPRADLVLTLDGARVEAAARPHVVDLAAARAVRIAYREDDGLAARLLALLAIAIRHPVRVVRESLHGRHAPPLLGLAPAALRIEREPDARLRVLGGEEARAAARRMAALSGRRLDG